jgi:hypothetical protein
LVTFLRRFVEILPRFKDKRQAIEITWRRYGLRTEAEQ